MNPMGRQYGGMQEWTTRTRSPGSYGEYDLHGAAGGGWQGFGYGYGQYEQPFAGYGERYGGYEQQHGEHVWRGGVLGWLGSGLRASASWIGEQLQSWGAVLGGKVKGTSAELGRAMRGRGEQMGSAMEERGEGRSRFARYEARPSRSYRRPDDRILDDVHQRIATAGVDAGEVEIEVNKGVVTLSGRVPHRFEKRVIEEIAEQVFGVQEVQNHLRLARRVDDQGAGEAASTLASGNGHRAGYEEGTEAHS
jgi:HSP20 family molecular chaperone IbpA